MNISTCPNRCLPVAALFLFFLLLTCVPDALAAEDAKKPTAKAASLHVTSDQMVAQQNNSMVEFIGNVRATRDDAVLLAESVKVFFHPRKSGETRDKGQGNVEKIIASGKVEYTAGDRKALADQAVYTTSDEKLVLTGKSPKLLTGKSWVTGRKITLFRLEERVMVESDGKTRVQAFFDSEDQKKGKD